MTNTTNLTAELARLNELNTLRNAGGSTPYLLGEAIALLNTMHALLVQAEVALAEMGKRCLIVDRNDKGDPVHYPCDALTALREAGIGGDRG